MEADLVPVNKALAGVKLIKPLEASREHPVFRSYF